MNIFGDLFQKIAVTITSVFIVVTSTFTGQKTPVQPTPSPSPIVEQAEATPSASITPKTTSKPKVVSVPTATPIFTPTPTLTPSSNSVVEFIPQQTIPTSQPTYRILTLSELGTLPTNNPPLMATIQDAYNNVFLQTPNLVYLTPEQQIQLFLGIVTPYIQNLANQVAQQQLIDKQQELIQKQQELNQLNSIPIPSSNNAYQECLNKKITSINSNPYLSESGRLGQIERAKYDCAN